MTDLSTPEPSGLDRARAGVDAQVDRGVSFFRKLLRVIIGALAIWGAFCLALLILAIIGTHHLAQSIF